MADGGDMGSFTKEIVPGDARAFRTALGQYSTGVTVVTAATATGPIGMTANSFASLSMEPPLVMWCPARASARHPHFVAARHVAIHVLSADQKRLADQFAREGHDFGGLMLDQNASGVPLIDGCLARFECTQVQSHAAGDHDIIVGEVIRATISDGDPLVFCHGKFGAFSDD